MRRIFIIVLSSWLCLMGLFQLSSCQDFEAADLGNSVKMREYSGTIYEYLADQNAHPGVTYDSLLYLLEEFPHLKDSLVNEQNLTLFALTDSSFINAFNSLNTFRTAYEKGRNLSLKDLMIEPFDVADTLVSQVGIEEYDTTVVYRHFDYKLQMDSLLCKYAFSQDLSLKSVFEDAGGEVETKSLIYKQPMRITAGRQAASGFENGGLRYIRLIDTKGTKITTAWIKADVDLYDVKASNGYVHQVSGQHEFAFNVLTSYFMNYGNEKK